MTKTIYLLNIEDPTTKGRTGSLNAQKLKTLHYCMDLGLVYEHPYVNMTSYPDEQLVYWKNQIDEITFGHANIVADIGYKLSSSGSN